MDELEVFIQRDNAVADSRDVARVIERPHKSVLRSIQIMIEHMERANSRAKNGPATEHKNVPSESISRSKNGPVTGAKNGLSEPTNRHKSVPVSRHKIVVSEFFIPSTYTDETGRTLPCFLCTRSGCDMIANKMIGEKGTLFTAAYVKRFREMERELARRAAQREIKAPIRRSLTDAIRDSGENERMHGQAFAAYTNLIYKATTGKTAPQLRKADGMPRGADMVGVLSSHDLAEITRREMQVATLLDCGMKYDDIKAALLAGCR